MAEKLHDAHAPGCPNCSGDAAGLHGDELCTCLTDGYAEGIKRWYEACPCCFSDAFPQGLEAALEEARS